MESVRIVSDAMCLLLFWIESDAINVALLSLAFSYVECCLCGYLFGIDAFCFIVCMIKGASVYFD